MTPEEGARKQIELYRKMTPQQRLQIGYELYDLAHEMIHCSVRGDHPEWDEAAVKREVSRRFRLAERIP
jgi:hypothetical protein